MSEKRRKQLIILFIFILTLGIYFMLDKFSYLADPPPDVTDIQREETNSDCLATAQTKKEEIDCLNKVIKPELKNLDYALFLGTEKNQVASQIQGKSLVLTRRDYQDIEICYGDFFFLSFDEENIYISMEKRPEDGTSPGIVICKYGGDQYLFYYPENLAKKDLDRALALNVDRLSLESLKQFFLEWKLSFEEK